MYEEEILCRGVEKKNDTSAVCLVTCCGNLLIQFGFLNSKENYQTML